jgi:hypothetical protein
VAKLTAQGYELLDTGRYVLEVVEAEPVNEYGPQLKLKLRVAEGENEGFEFVDYPNRGAENGVKVGTKAWDVFEACLNQRLSPDEELDTDDLAGKRFQAMVVAKKTGKGNRTEHGRDCATPATGACHGACGGRRHDHRGPCGHPRIKPTRRAGSSR